MCFLWALPPIFYAWHCMSPGCTRMVACIWSMNIVEPRQIWLLIQLNNWVSMENYNTGKQISKCKGEATSMSMASKISLANGLNRRFHAKEILLKYIGIGVASLLDWCLEMTLVGTMAWLFFFSNRNMLLGPIYKIKSVSVFDTDENDILLSS